MKFFTYIVSVTMAGLVAASTTLKGVDYALLKARHFAEGKPVFHVLGNHVREVELVVHTTTGEEVIQRDMSPNDAAVLFSDRCCSIKCGNDVCCCNGCC